jgi:type III restriction enzyme
MKLQFKTQEYQSDATKAITDLFIGQSKGLREDIIDRKIVKIGLVEEEIITKRFSNQEISPNTNILENIQNVQKKDSLLKQSLDLKAALNFTIEMETGTGKTYVYTKACFELNRLYGWSKFIIVVPSIAIREGVHKSLEITKEHFKDKYHKTIRYFIYDTKNSSNLTNISNFSNSSNIEVMIVNYQAFATNSQESRKIYEKQDSMQSLRPIDVLNRTKPILIIDEPQRLGKTAESKLAEFKALFTLRFSATHKDDFHKIYRLDAIDAYNQKLVKKISVKAISVQGDSATGGYVFFDSIILSKNNPEALIEIDVKQTNSIVKKPKKVKEGDNLYEISQGLAQYQDSYVVSSIDARTNTIKFLNGITLSAGEVVGSVEEKHLRRIQIRETIRSHIQKEKVLFKKGIKVLSLFFIDEVAKYRVYDENNTQVKGEYELIFEEEYKKVIEENRTLFDEQYFKYIDKLDLNTIHKGYFSIDKKGKAITKESDIQNDVSAYDLIMKDKERLLDFAEPTRFIFSHSALKEGWDNPNVFQICTLKHSNSSDSKRQEIGRGLRICVDKHGFRQDFQSLESEFFDINSLTVIASESYEEFAKTLQKEILESLSRETKITAKLLEQISLKNEKGEVLKISKDMANELFEDWKTKDYIDDDGFITQKAMDDFRKNDFEVTSSFIGFEKELKEIIKQASSSAIVKNMIDNAKSNNEMILKPNENFYKKEFQELWKKINSKATYSINIDSEDLIINSIEAINQSLEVQKVKVQIVSSSQKNSLEIDDLSKNKTIMQEAQNFYESMDYELGFTKYDLIGEIVKNTQITRKTAVSILSKIREDKFFMFKTNPEDFILKVAKIINTQKVKLIISGIKYHKTNEVYDTDIFTIANFKCNLSEDSGDTIEVKRHIYDYLKFDSKVEKNFANAMDNGQVVVYAKLPNDFKIPTPLGGYNPDWAVVFERTDKKNIYFVAETKGNCEELQLKGAEDLKIAYAKKYFEYLEDENITYDCVKNYKELIEKILK